MHMTGRLASVTLGSTTFLSLAWLVFGSTQGQPDPNKPKDAAKGPAAFPYYASNSCIGCHDRYVDPVGIPITCTCNEFETWETKDKHRLAYVALKGELAKSIGKNLKIDVQNDKRCVSCHGVWFDDEKQKEKYKTLVEEGISCFVCHGPNKGWLREHGEPVEEPRLEWRKKNREVKEREYGMTDLWDTSKRARLCVSCHIGNAEEGRVITHEMYAAGHPPLPSFDMANFSDAMRHWQLLAEKQPEVIDTFKFTKAQVDQERLDLVYLGNLVSLEASVRLLEHQARAKDTWPEFAQFDCYACHHDLKSNEWRHQRGYEGKPGRPPMHAWPTALAKVSLEYCARGDEKKTKTSVEVLHAKLKKLRDALDSKPFGEPTHVSSTARELADWLDAQVKSAPALKDLDASLHRKMLSRLVEHQQGKLMDFESARQIAGAFRITYLEGWKKDNLKQGVVSQLNDLDENLHITFAGKNREKHRDARLDVTKELFSFRKKKAKDASKFLDSKLPILQDAYRSEMGAYLEANNRFDAMRFQENFRKLAASALGEKR